jgi:sec-independent protein translocase protein TatB
MFGLGITEIVVILVVALLFLGPEKLPEVAKSLGKGLRDFRKATDEIRDSVQGTVTDAVREVTRPVPPPTVAPSAAAAAVMAAAHPDTPDAAPTGGPDHTALPTYNPLFANLPPNAAVPPSVGAAGAGPTADHPAPADSGPVALSEPSTAASIKPVSEERVPAGKPRA